MPTNQEWLHKLANESPDELKAWFDAEHNDNLAAEKVVSCDAAHSNDGNAHLKASEDLSDGFTDSRENLGSEPSTSEVFGGKGSEVDSREKLEADIWYFIEHNGWFGYEYEAESYADSRKAVFEIFKEWLDRQAAISEREHPGLTISDDESLINWRGKNYMLQSRVFNAERERDEFSLKLKHEMELNRDNRNALDLERIAEMQAIIDELSAERDVWKTKCETREVAYKQANAERKRYSEQIDKLQAERDNLAADLLTCNREREQLRKHLGIALDHAHDICSLVDIDGNVLDVGD